MHAAGRDAAAAQSRDHVRERAQLRARGREIGLVRAREVRHHARERERGIARDAGEERFRVGERHAHPAHSGIDLDVHGDRRAAAPARRRRERRASLGVVEHRGELARDHLVGLARVAGAREHEQRGRDAGVAQRDGFPDAPGRERVAAGRHERARHGRRSVPVGVGLHHRDHAAPGGETRRLGVVRAQRIEVDRRDRRPETARGCQRATPFARARHARRVAYHRAVMTEPALATVAITVNGEPCRTPAGSHVTDLIAQLGLDGRRVAVAIGREVVPRSEHAPRRLRDGDRVEILEAVGGG